MQNGDLTGKIFHFKPNRDRFHGQRNTPPKVEHPQPIPPEPDETKGGRRSNRLFALHPVVVLKKLPEHREEAIPEEGRVEEETEKKDVRAGGHSRSSSPAGNHTSRRDSGCWIKPTVSDQTSLFTPPTANNAYRRDSLGRTLSWLGSQTTALPTPPATPGSTPVSSPATSPLSETTTKRGLHDGARRPSLERRDAEEQFAPRQPVMICNITSQVHDAINDKNYLPIAAPGREYSDHLQKRLFLSPEPSPNGTPSTSPDEHWEKHTEIWDARSDFGSSDSCSTNPTEYSPCSVSEMEPMEKRERDEKALAMFKKQDDIPPSRIAATKHPSFLSSSTRDVMKDETGSVLPDEGFEKSSDELWEEQVNGIDELMADYVPMPRHDSFVRLDSRTTVDVSELSAFLRPSGNQYELHPSSRDLLWQSVLECERGYKHPHEYVLGLMQETTEAQVQGKARESLTQGVNELSRATSRRLKQHIRWPREQHVIDKILEEQTEQMLNLMLDIHNTEQKALKDTYDSLHCHMALVPTEKEKPFHPEQPLGRMLRAQRERTERGEGEGSASLNKPIKSTLALKAIAEGKPLPNKREEARAHRKSVSNARPHRANSNPEDVRPNKRVPSIANHPLASKHSNSSGAIAAQSERPKATLDNKSFATPRIKDKNWTEASDWRGSSKKESRHSDTKATMGSDVLEMKRSGSTVKGPGSRSHSTPVGPVQPSKDSEIPSTPIHANSMPTPQKAGFKLKGEARAKSHSKPVATAQPPRDSEISSTPQQTKQMPIPQKKAGFWDYMKGEPDSKSHVSPVASVQLLKGSEVSSIPIHAKQTPTTQKKAGSIVSINETWPNTKQMPSQQKADSPSPPAASYENAIAKAADKPISTAFKGPPRDTGAKDVASNLMDRQPVGPTLQSQNFNQRGKSGQHPDALNSESFEASELCAVESVLAPSKSASNLQKISPKLRERRDSGYGHQNGIENRYSQPAK